MSKAGLALILAGCASAPVRPSGPPRRDASASPFAYEHYLRAEIESEQGHAAVAATLLRRAVASDPKSCALRMRLAIELSRAGRLEEAETEAWAAAALDPQDAGPTLLLGELAWRRGDHAAAEAALREALLRQPGLERAHQRLSDLTLQRGDRAAFEAGAREWVARIPDSAEAWCRIGRVEVDRGDAPAAARAYSRCVEIAPQRIAAYLRLAEVREAAGDVDRAVATLRGALTRAAETLPVLESLVPLLTRLGREREAAKLISAIDPQAHTSEALVSIGYLVLAAGGSVRAEALGREALVLQPPSPRAPLLVADALAARGERVAALRELERLGPMSPRHVEARTRIIALLREDGYLDEALVLARRLSAEHPALAEPHELAASCLLREGDLTAALHEVKEALRIEPDRPSSLSLLGLLYAERGDSIEDAEALARRALAAWPGSGQVLHDLGWIAFRAGRLEEARRHLERAARAEPGSETIRRHLEQLRARAAAPDRRRR